MLTRAQHVREAAVSGAHGHWGSPTKAIMRTAGAADTQVRGVPIGKGESVRGLVPWLGSCWRAWRRQHLGIDPEKVGVTGARSASRSPALKPNCCPRPSFCSPRFQHRPSKDQAMAVTMPTEPAWWLGPRFVTSACERNHSRSRPPCACHRWMDGQGVWPPPPRRGDVPSGGSPSPGPRWCSLVGCPRLGRRLALPPKVRPPSGIPLIASALRSGSVGRSRRSPLPASAAHPRRSCPQWPLTHH
ncbi:hypothetical protein HD593_009574 [Nonomuraea rubra]|uniref:Uncharacterized protein n=1 Tax=Nonomuraea rubra TaxID=46180 RepID=A0A7X0P476_9ACTN|nr:hypothetical protein [Nonomuraea rubra]